MAYTAIYSADFIFEKTPLSLHSNVKEFGVKRKGVLVETQKSFVLNVSAFWGGLKNTSLKVSSIHCFSLNFQG